MVLASFLFGMKKPLSVIIRGLFHVKQINILIRMIAEKEGRALTFWAFALMFSIKTGFKRKTVI